MKIAYEPHPVTPERKAELRAQGFKIIDARFKPADVDEPDEIAGMDGAELTEALEAHGIEDVPHKLDDRRELLRKVMFVGV
jgi:hypothetical protein